MRNPDDTEEREILDAYRTGKLERIALSADEIVRYREAARAVADECGEVTGPPVER